MLTQEQMQNKLGPRFSQGWDKWISTEPGWYNLISLIDESLAKIDPEYTIQQVKEKFGGLRFYATPTNLKNETDGFIWNAIIHYGEYLSTQTCEKCGIRQGQQKDDLTYVLVMSASSPNGWVRTLCTDCRVDTPTVES